MPRHHGTRGLTLACVLALCHGLTACGSSEPPAHTVTAHAGDGGSITPASVTVEDGETAAFTVSPDAGFVVDDVTGCGGARDGMRYVTAPVTVDCEVTATFTRPLYQVAVSASPSTGGTVEGGGQYPFGTEVTVSATPAEGWDFVRWTHDSVLASTEASFTFTVGSHRTLVANFEPTTYTVDAEAGDGGAITPGSQTVIHGETATFTVTADAGHVVDAVTGCEGTLDGDAYTTGLIFADCSVAATFSPILHTVEVVAEPAEAGSVEGGGIYPWGTEVTVTATPAGSWTFWRWTEDGEAVSTDATHTFVVDADRVLVAEFEFERYAVGGTVTGLADGRTLVLELNGSHTIEVDGSGPFVFDVTVPDGDAYAVSIALQPGQHDCIVESGEGTMDGAAVDDVVVSCAGFPIVATGAGHTLAIRPDGTLWAFGQGDMGQLGLGDWASRDVPVQVGDASDWRAVAAGSEHSLAIRADGSLWAWGDGTSGRLGLGSATSTPLPVQVGSDVDWQAVAAGESHSLAIKTDGTLFAWGDDADGQLGLGGTGERLEPAQVGNDDDWASVAAGARHGLALKTTGSLWAWGDNASGQLGVGDIAERSVPTRIGDASDDWHAVAAGATYSLALRDDGRLFAFGDNAAGQLGVGDTGPRTEPTAVADAWRFRTVTAGLAHTLAIRDDGRLFAWGANGSGELGLGYMGTDAVSTPEQVGSGEAWRAVHAGGHHTVAVEIGGEVWAWGRGDAGQLGLGVGTHVLEPAQGPETIAWRSIAAGDDFTLGIRADGTLWAWGVGDDGQLGLGDTVSRQAPEQVGTDEDWDVVFAGDRHALALKTDGSLWAWGANEAGQLGLGVTSPDPDHLAPERVGEDADWQTVAAGDYHTLAINTDGFLFAWGSDAYGQLGLDGTGDRDAPTQVGEDDGWESVAAGYGHSLALKTDGSLWAWGHNGYGELGLSDNTDRDAPAQLAGTEWRSVSAGWAHTLGLSGDGELYAWGYGAAGQLGRGNFTSRNGPGQVGSDTDWAEVSAGSLQSFGIRDDGRLWAWGHNLDGQLGLGDQDGRNVPEAVAPALTWQAVSGGWDHTLALDADGLLWSWGSAETGALGVQAARFDSPQAVSFE